MLGRRKDHGRGEGSSSPDEVYRNLRSLAIAAATELPAPPPEHPDVSGVVVDIPRDGGFITFVALTDDTTSMYTSSGGGTIGGGVHPDVAAATHALLARLQADLELFPPDDTDADPTDRYVQVTVLTPSGRRRAAIPNPAFWGEEPSGVLPLIVAIHGVISAVRTITPED